MIRARDCRAREGASRTNGNRVVTRVGRHRMATIRVARRNRFTTIDRRAVSDERLSFRALGLLVWLLDKPDDWRTDSAQIARDRREGRDAIRTALSELEDCGYIIRRKVRIAGGRFAHECHVFEVPPGPDFQASVGPATDFPAPVDQAQDHPASEDQAASTEDCDRSLSPKTVTDDGQPNGVAPLVLVPPSAATVGNDQLVFDTWVTACGRTERTVLSPKRRRLIRQALAQYPLDDVLDAVRGWKYSEWHTGNNPGRVVYNEIELLLRDSSKIEMFRDYARGARDRGVDLPVPESWKTLRDMGLINANG